MISRRKWEALRALAERPGTPAEGEAARAALARLQGKRARHSVADLSEVFERYMRRAASVEEFIEACRRYREK